MQRGFADSDSDSNEDIDAEVPVHHGRTVGFNGDTTHCSSAIDAGEGDMMKKSPRRVNPANARELERQLQGAEPDAEDAEEERQPERRIPNGSSVTVRGLQSEAARALNGMTGRVLSFNADKGRYDVDLEGQVKAIKFENLQVSRIQV